jgi:hypothetical protein
MKKRSWQTLVSLGYRFLYMYSEASQSGSSFKEEDRYQGPFFSIRVRYSGYVSDV